jgi:hypothetical protein
MHRTFGRLMIALAFTGFAASANADAITVGDTLTFADGPGTTGGGEFLVTINGVEQFITFCLQRTEYMNFSTTFTIQGVNTYTLTDTVANGGDPLTGQDHLSPHTAWLYTQFRANTLAGYDYLGPNRWQSANALQNAIWWFENELSSNPSNAFVTAANEAVAAGWTRIGDVRVMNLFFPSGAEAQDQLALVDTTTQVPEPTTLMLVGSGLAIGVWRRSRRNRRA